RLHVPGAGEFEPLDAHLGDPVNLFDGVVDVAIRQAGETDLAVGLMPAGLLAETAVDAQHRVRAFAAVATRGGAEHAGDALHADRDVGATSSSGGIHGMLRWQSAEILRYCISFSPRYEGSPLAQLYSLPASIA